MEFKMLKALLLLMTNLFFQNYISFSLVNKSDKVILN
jgi:hypothetical protein